LLVIILAVVGLFLPGTYHVERSVTITASSSDIYPYLNSLKKWPEWTAWTVAKYPDMKISFEGPESGAGAIYHWDGKSSGQGTLKLTQSSPTNGVFFDLSFDHGKYLSKGSILMDLSDEGVEVTWTNEGVLGWNPVNRYFGLFMDRMMGPDFQKGLENLKLKLENLPK
ncbi:MAG: SRPBCC family protein, partial [Opitutaceae bacterium]|nr:SRPBCC family protein [Verrucomicrobiales bacterium]